MAEVPFASIAHDVVESLIEGCQVVDADYRYLYVNEALVQQAKLTREQLLGRTMMECYPGIEATPMFAMLTRCLRERTHARMENEFTYPDGATGWFELRFLPVPKGVCVLSNDVTGRKRAQAALASTEEQLRHAQKMEAVGRLAGGVAHDFNNVLSVVLSYAVLLRDQLPVGDPMRADVEEIHLAGQRASELTRQLLAFSRQQVLELETVDLGQAVLAMERMIQRLLGADVEVVLLRGHGLWKVRANAGHVEQILMNFAVNARDAMPEGGKLTIEVKNVVLDADYARVHHEVTPGEHVMVAVTDTGVGMSQETLVRIFEPFFTTKEKGKGTGLGLATVFGIVKQSGGHVWVYSELGQGTTFKVYFPRYVGAGAIARPAPPAAPRPAGGSETILLVDDDEQVRGVAKGVLRRLGYVVLEAQNAGEAVLICEQHPASIHLLVTDVVMPRLGGRALVERAGAIRPDMRVLYMSGYADETILHHGILESGVAYLQKPLTPESLARKVRQVLDEPRGPDAAPA